MLQERTSENTSEVPSLEEPAALAPTDPFPATASEREPFLRRSFHSHFQVKAEHVILDMDQAGDDPAQQAPSFAIPIRRVGVDRHHVPVRLQPTSKEAPQTLQCRVRVRTELPATHRGIHVSRLGDVVADLAERTFVDLTDYARTCATMVAHRQYGGPTEVEVSGNLSFVTPVLGWKDEKSKRSLDTIGVHAACFWTPGVFTCQFGLEVDHITACPCVQQTMKHTARRAATLPTLPPGAPPLLTHSQRCRTRVAISTSDGPLPSLESLLRAVEQVVFRTQSTLPREHELLLVHESHRRPQFLEDVLREVAMAVAGVCSGMAQETVVTVSSTSFESIHEYDLHGQLSWTLGELRDFTIPG
jgi:GTP cyclohydrolase FolE2